MNELYLIALLGFITGMVMIIIQHLKYAKNIKKVPSVMNGLTNKVSYLQGMLIKQADTIITEYLLNQKGVKVDRVQSLDLGMIIYRIDSTKGSGKNTVKFCLLFNEEYKICGYALITPSKYSRGLYNVKRLHTEQAVKFKNIVNMEVGDLVMEANRVQYSISEADKTLHFSITRNGGKAALMTVVEYMPIKLTEDGARLLNTNKMVII